MSKRKPFIPPHLRADKPTEEELEAMKEALIGSPPLSQRQAYQKYHDDGIDAAIEAFPEWSAWLIEVHATNADASDDEDDLIIDIS